jgi:hypothetical protein
MLQFMTVITISTVLSVIAYKMQHQDLKLISAQLSKQPGNEQNNYLRE